MTGGIIVADSGRGAAWSTAEMRRGSKQR